MRIGSGSDHTVFLNFLGFPSSGCNSTARTASITRCTTISYWMNHFGDPGYRYHALMSQLWGVLALRLANADALPFDFGAYGRAVREFVEELKNHNQLEGQLDTAPLFKAIATFEQQGVWN